MSKQGRNDMLRTVLTFGLISGGVLAALTATIVPMCLNGTMDFENSEILGYTTMALSFLAVFFGIRSYRQNVMGGTITFGKAFKVGILITLVTCSVYVAGWEIVYWNFVPDFGDKYAAKMMEKMEKSGASAEKVAAEKAKMASFQKLYKNPLFNVGITFLEVFPMGLVMTLIASGALRKKGTAGPGAVTGAPA